MAKQYKINIVDGTTTKDITNGTYNVTASSIGYDASSIDPSTITVNDESDTLTFKISASGTLILHVTDDGTTAGNPINGAIFYRCDELGTTTYGTPVTSNENGLATFENLPYSTTDTAPTVYIKQTASDDSHNFDPTPYNYILDQEQITEEIFNEPAATKTINLTDANYEIPIGTAEITLDEQV